MSNVGRGNGFWQQKRRNFVYSAPSGYENHQTSNAHPLSGNPSGARVADVVIPRKKMKSSHDYYGRKLEDEAVAELCQDLAPDAFDDDGVEIEDDFEDNDVLTAEQLDEVDRIASLELEVPDKLTEQLSKEKHHAFDSQKVTTALCASKHVTWSCNSKQQEINFTGHQTRNIWPITISDSHDVSQSVPVCESVPLFSQMSESLLAGNVSARASEMHGNVNNASERSWVSSLQKQLAELKTDHVAAKTKIKFLEEEKFGKDGELKILRDSLEHFRNEEKKLHEQMRSMQQKQLREQSEKEKELEKQVESLNTRLQFKEREVMQALEQNKKLSVTNHSPSKRKPLTSVLGDTFPTGNSFFHQSSPDRQKCPKLSKASPRTPNTLQKNSSEACSSTKSSPVSVTDCQKEELPFKFEKNLMRIDKFENRCGVNLVGKLLSLENAETGNLDSQYNIGSPAVNSIISLLRENPQIVEKVGGLQKGNDCETVSCETLKLFDTQVSSVRTQSATALLGNSGQDEDNYLLALQSLEKLVNFDCDKSQISKLLSFLDLDETDGLPSRKDELSVVKILPVLESYLVRYLDHRQDVADESINSTGSKNLSTFSGTPESKDDGTVEQHKVTIRTLESVWNTLRVLNVLCLYSSEVRNTVLSCGEQPLTQSEGEARLQKVVSKPEVIEEAAMHRKHAWFPEIGSVFCKASGIEVKSESFHSKMPDHCPKLVTAVNVVGSYTRQKSELLQLLFRLVIPQQSEALAVTHAALRVLLSLASNCSLSLLPRLLPLLSESLLSQCLAKDFTLPTVALVTDLLTSLVPQNDLSKRLCSQTDDCIMLKLYQALGLTSDTLDHVQQNRVHLKIVQFLNQLLSTDEDTMHLLLEADCQCSLELIKNLVLLLHCELKELIKFPVSSFLENADASSSLQLVRQGVFLLVNLFLNDRLLVDHRYRVEVEHQYVHLLCGVTRLYKRIPDILSEIEVLALQDLLDLDRFDDIEWSQESDDEEACEGMDVDS